MSSRISFGVLAAAAIVAACEPAPTAPHEAASIPGASTFTNQASAREAMDRLARRVARAMADPGFRSYVKEQLDRSPFGEHKVQFQGFLRASNGRALKEVARLSAASETEIEDDASNATPLEMYFPVPAHRTAWSGGPDLLVASAWEDHESPVAYDVLGKRQLLSPVDPPATPVLAVEPVETDFAHPLGQGSQATCTTACGGGGGGGTSPPPGGLYMTYSHFVQDFEGWLKGDPEFEIHILGQSGASDSLRDYQCAGGAGGGYYHFDQNDLNWTGSVLLFSQTQLNNYKTAHPNQNFRVVALEDDDTGCAIKFDGNRFKSLISTIQSQYPNLTGSKDTATTIAKYVKRANALQKILAAAYSFITTQDDLIGNAIEDVVVGVFYPGANWIFKGESNVTNGWIKLEMR
ncbi:MAG TPA: hypothetical protein VFX42_05655 [Gemmatimonadales bacterium]|nr:hypothetical protein [Gemmatimonadales bacterium]